VTLMSKASDELGLPDQKKGIGKKKKGWSVRTSLFIESSGRFSPEQRAFVTLLNFDKLIVNADQQN